MNRLPVRPSPEKRCSITVRGMLLIAVAVYLPLCCLFGSAPSWWATQGVLDSGAPRNDYAPINQGQLKNIAVKAYAEMQNQLPPSAWTNTAGTNLTALISSFSTNGKGNYAPVNLGQLKTVVRPFYDVLIQQGMQTNYPWTATTNSGRNFGVVNIGQVKNAFSFGIMTPVVPPPANTDHNEFNDEWETTNFGHLGVDPNDDPDHDLLTNLEEYEQGSDPNEYYNGRYPFFINILQGNGQNTTQGLIAPVPLKVTVVDVDGFPFAGAPVTFTVTEGSGLVKSDANPMTVGATSISLRTDASGEAQVYFLQPTGANQHSSIECSSTSPDYEDTATFGLRSLPDIPTSGLGLWFEADSGTAVGEYDLVTSWQNLAPSTDPAVSPPYEPLMLMGEQEGFTGTSIMNSGGEEGFSITEDASLRVTDGLTIVALVESPDYSDAFTVLGRFGSGGIEESSYSLQTSFTEAAQASVHFTTTGGDFDEEWSTGLTPFRFKIVSVVFKDALVSMYLDGVLIKEVALTDSIVCSLSDEVRLCESTGQVAALLFYNRGITNSERLQIEEYLIGKYDLPAPQCVISPEGGYSAGDVLVTISHPAPVPAVVRYTLDGSEPDESSPEYDTPITVSPSAILVAKAFPEIGRPSYPTQQAYTNDTDGDGMPDAWEVLNGLDPGTDDSLGDLDGDGVSNIMEYYGGSVANDPDSVPATTAVVALAGGPGTYATIQDAIDANLSDPITVIEMAPGTYDGTQNHNIVASKPLIIRSTSGAAQTVIDGGGTARIFEDLGTHVLIQGVTLKGGYAVNGAALNVYTGSDVILKDCLITGNEADYGAAVNVRMGKVKLFNCTIFANVVPAGGNVVHSDGDDGSVEIVNCILWNSSSSEIDAANATVSSSIVKGGYTGTGNLSSNPLLTPDGHLTSTSPARGAGVTSLSTDCDGEGGSPRQDIGADLFVTTSSNPLPSYWRTLYGVSSSTADADGDGLTNLAEFEAGTSPTNTDTDGDGLADNVEISLHTNPLLKDSDGDGLTDGDEVNVYHTDPLNPDTDGDGFSDGFEVSTGRIGE